MSQPWLANGVGCAGGPSLRIATWWANPKIPTTTDATRVKCWSDSLDKPGAVQVVTSGHWNDQEIGLTGGSRS